MQKPNVMRCLYKDSKEGKSYLPEVPIPTFEEGQLLIRMDYAPINPSEIKFFKANLAQINHFHQFLVLKELVQLF